MQFEIGDKVIVLPSILDAADCLGQTDRMIVNGQTGIITSFLSDTQPIVTFDDLPDTMYWIRSSNLALYAESSFDTVEQSSIDSLLGV